jgi:hypothetical protein
MQIHYYYYTTAFAIISVIVTIICVGRYCDSRRKVLLKHVHEGYDKELWEYQDSFSSS